MSDTLLLITYHGRKSGREYSLPVQYVQDGNQIYIIPGAPEQKTWWRNLKDGAAVQIILRGKTMNGNGILLKQDVDAETVVKGSCLYLKRFPGLAKSYNVHVEADGTFNPGDVRQAAASVVMIRVELDIK